MRRFLLILLTALLLAGTASAALIPGRPEGDLSCGLEIVFLAAGEGDAILLRCGGECMMVDGGPSGTRESVLNGLRSMGVESFRYLVATHCHDDHINGLTWVMREGFSVEAFCHPYTVHEVPRFDLCARAVREAEKRGISVQRLVNGDILTLGGAEIEFLRTRKFDGANAKSLAARVTFGGSSAFLCADIIGEVQGWYAETLPPEKLKADVLKVPHHGITPIQSDFLTAVDPLAAVITNNRERGIRAAEQLERREISAFYSADGHVRFYTDGIDWHVWQE